MCNNNCRQGRACTCGVSSTTLTISEQSLALLILDNEVHNNQAEVNRLAARLRQAQIDYDLAAVRLEKNKRLLSQAQDSIKKIDWRY